MKKRNIHGIVLQKRIFLESDLFLTVLSEEGEKIEFLVKGANGRSKRRSHIELLNVISGSCYQGSRHLYLQEVRCENSFWRLKEDLDRILDSQEVISWLCQQVHAESPHPEIYEQLLDFLQELNQKEPRALSKEIVLLQLSHQLGFLPNFKECSECHRTILDEETPWNSEQGTLHCKSCQPELTEHLALKYRKAIEFLKEHRLGNLPSLKWEDSERQALKNLVQNLITSRG